jgi:hypothetical protein
MKRDKQKTTSNKSALFSKIMSVEVQIIYMKIDTLKVFSYLSNVYTLQMHANMNAINEDLKYKNVRIFS